MHVSLHFQATHLPVILRSRALARRLEGSKPARSWPIPSRLAVKNGEHLRMTAVLYGQSCCQMCACPSTYGDDLRIIRRQNKLSCCPLRFGRAKWSVVSFERRLLSPSFSQAISKRRPIIQAIGPVPFIRVPHCES